MGSNLLFTSTIKSVCCRDVHTHREQTYVIHALSEEEVLDADHDTSFASLPMYTRRGPYTGAAG